VPANEGLPFLSVSPGHCGEPLGRRTLLLGLGSWHPEKKFKRYNEEKNKEKRYVLTGLYNRGFEKFRKSDFKIVT